MAGGITRKVRRARILDHTARSRPARKRQTPTMPLHDRFSVSSASIQISRHLARAKKLAEALSNSPKPRGTEIQSELEAADAAATAVGMIISPHEFAEVYAACTRVVTKLINESRKSTSVSRKLHFLALAHQFVIDIPHLPDVLASSMVSYHTEAYVSIAHIYGDRAYAAVKRGDHITAGNLIDLAYSYARKAGLSIS
ncbi:hypothetical protein HZC07_03075 [Candidatus Micrarchaeota archaeon]|nr:hypothetical protein [Candidatus Micrarchaeota archaeon]